MNNLSNATQIKQIFEKENSNTELLKERVEKYKELSSAMSNIFSSFRQRLGKLEETILPVYNETENLQQRQRNLEQTLQLLDIVLDHYDVSQDVCNLIHIGPTDGNVSEYLAALDRLKRGIDYFNTNNDQSVELQNVTSLYNTGCETLNNHFRMLLRKHSQPLKPVDLLDLIYIEEDSSNDDCSSIGQLSTFTKEELHTIAEWLNSHLRREYMTIYADERSEVIFRSLQLLKDHQRSGSWGREVLKPRPSAVSAHKNEPRKSTSARIQMMFERKANKMFLKATHTLEQSTGITIKKGGTSGTGIGSSTSGSMLSEQLIGDDHDVDQELEKYLVLLHGMLRLLNWERNMLMEIVPTRRCDEVFTLLARNSADMIVRDAENITTKVQRSISRKEWAAALGAFSAIKYIMSLQPDIDKIFVEKDSKQRAQMLVVMTRFEQTGIKALEQFLDLVKSDGSSGLVGMSASTLSGSSSVPRDATVHELTSNTVWFIEHLYDHCEVIGAILKQDIVYASQLDTIIRHTQSLEDKNRALLGIYIKKVLSELNLTIVSKCEQYADVATRHLFRLNNIHYILKSLQRSKLLDLVSMTEPSCEKQYQDLIQELKSNYQKSWSRLLSNISPLDELPKVTGGKVRDKDRPILKERFSTFNKDLDDACKIQRGISVPDVILREGIKRDNVEHLIPQYNAFFEIYSDSQFSKQPEKYVKYRPQDVSAMLNNLFDDRL